MIIGDSVSEAYLGMFLYPIPNNRAAARAILVENT